jgi:4-amino-4-deoxy-L-arabinose transferase-like glycosyltransferase
MAETPPVPRWALPTVLVLFSLLAALYSVVVPAFETPDEIWHFAFIQYVAMGQGLPVATPNTQALWRQQGVQAPGYYLLAAGLTGWIDQSDFPALYARANPHAAIGRPDTPINRNYLVHHRDEGPPFGPFPWRGSLLALHLARLLSVGLGTATLWAAYRAVTPLLGPAAALTGVTILAFIPQYVFISAAASNDNAVNALAALLLWQIVVLVAETPVERLTPTHLRRRFLTLGVLLGLALLSKLSALGLVGLVGLAVLWAAWRAHDGRIVLAAALWIGLPAALLGGWWYVRNWLLYGDLLAWNLWRANILLRVQEADTATILGELGSLERSFWGLFGWVNLPYPAWVYTLLRGLAGLVALGWLLAAVTWLLRSRRVDRRAWGAALLILWLLLLTVSWLRFMRIAPAAQGRYLFPAAPTLALLIALGLRAWHIGTLGPLVAGALVLLSAVTPFWIIAPAYRPPPPVAALPAGLQPVEAQVGPALAILGVDAAPAALTPGATATITVAWEARATVDHDYSIFIHLVDDDGLIAAQLDTMPGGGLAPTSQWRPGERRAETYRVTLPSTAYTPARGQWAIGLYDAYHPDTPRLPLTRVRGDVRMVDRALRFGAVAISPPPGALPNPVEMAFADNITLAGYALNRRRLRPGESLEVTLYWRTRGPVAGDYTVFAHLLDGGYTMHGGHDGRPDPPTSDWTPGQIVEDHHRFDVPAAAPPGVYQLEVGLYTRPDFDRLALLAAEGAEGADRLLLGPLEIVAQ